MVNVFGDFMNIGNRILDFDAAGLDICKLAIMKKREYTDKAHQLIKSNHLFKLVHIFLEK